MITNKLLNELKKSVDSSEINIKNKMFNKTSLLDLVTDYKDTLDKEFNIEIKTHGILDQKSTGRCWSFAGLNILREKVIEKCNLNSFELSGSYIAFYDKLERFNYLMEKLEEYSKTEDEYGRNIQDILKTGFDDGSNYTEFKGLVKKYGVVPKNCYSNGFHSNDTGELNDILSRLLRKYYIDLIKGNNNRNEFLKEAYKILVLIYGTPIDKFDFEYKDKDGVYHIDKNISPKKFYDKYIGIDLDDYIEIYSFQDKKYKYNNVYRQINILSDGIILNLKNKELEELMVNQLKNGELVYFSSSTTTKYSNGLWLDLMDRYSNILDVDLRLSNNDIVRTYGEQGEHSMVMTGVSIITGSKKWKIENSWGDKEGLNGYFIAEDIFIKNYLISAVINKKYLSKEQKKLLNKKPILVDKWDYKFC